MSRRPLQMLLVVLGLWACKGLAQPVSIPRIEAAETEFAQALQAFERGDYGLAYRQFRRVIDAYPPHRRTTAAWIMAAKTLYRLGEYDHVIAWAETFAVRYPTSRYQREARRLRRLAEAALHRRQQQTRMITLGILLPMDPANAPLTQALFDGIRLAVEARNADSLAAPVRMVFQDAGTTPGQVQEALQQLINEQEADLVIGPLYSEQARAAAEVAEQHHVVLVAPLATDEAVSEGRHFVFQANPTLAVRGQLMARMAVYGLRLDSIGIVAQADDLTARRMAEAFQAEVLRLKAAVLFYKRLSGPQAWAQLTRYIGRDTLAQVQALYLPLSGSNAPMLARAALSSLDRAGLTPRVLGNAVWRDVQAALQASRYWVTFSNDFYVDTSRVDVKAFMHHYRLLGRSQAPDRLVYTGYDVTRFLLEHLPDRSALNGLADRIRSAPLYQGLSIRLHFDGGQVNRALYVHRYRDGRLELLR